jgi:hypothetical protein
VVLDSDLNRLLRSVGLRVFVEYFDVFSNLRLSNQEAADLLPHDYKLTARLTRVSCARRIIERGQADEVLRFISESKRVDAATSQAALSLLGNA